MSAPSPAELREDMKEAQQMLDACAETQREVTRRLAWLENELLALGQRQAAK